jgi:hypothetical protein
MAKEEILYILI